MTRGRSSKDRGAPRQPSPKPAGPGPTGETQPRPVVGIPPEATPAWARWTMRAILVAVPAVLAGYYLRAELAAQGRLGYPLDDPYIHLQFARNLAHGAGFSFNPGEPTPGATSPLWVVLLAGGSLLGAPLEWMPIVLGILAACAAAVLTFELGRACRLGEPLAFLGALAMALAGRFTWASLSGMEACLAAAAAAGLLRLQLSELSGMRRYVILGLVAGLAAQVRPELALLGALVGAGEVWRALRGPRRSEALRAALGFGAAFAAVALPYTLFCLATTGRPLPNTYYAKSYFTAITDSPMLRRQRAIYLPEMWRWIWKDSAVVAALIIPGIVLWLVRGSQRRALVVALWPLAFWASAMARAPFHFNWSRYTIPLMPSLALLGMLPLAWLQGRLRTDASRRLLELVAAVLILVGATESHLDSLAGYQANVDNTLKMQVRMGEWVAAHLPPGSRVALNDVGAITYYGRRYCIDVMGLVNSDMITFILDWRRTHPAGDPDLIVAAFLDRARPDYCIIFPSWFPRMSREPWLRKISEIDYPNITGGGNELVVYRVVKQDGREDPAKDR